MSFNQHCLDAKTSIFRTSSSWDNFWIFIFLIICIRTVVIALTLLKKILRAAANTTATHPNCRLYKIHPRPVRVGQIFSVQEGDSCSKESKSMSIAHKTTCLSDLFWLVSLQIHVDVKLHICDLSCSFRVMFVGKSVTDDATEFSVSYETRIVFGRCAVLRDCLFLHHRPDQYHLSSMRRPWRRNNPERGVRLLKGKSDYG